MKITKTNLGTFIDPEFDRNFSFGVYEQNGAYNDESTECFQNKPGNLRGKEYFIVEGKSMPKAKKEIKELIKNYNWEEETSLQGLQKYIASEFPGIKIFDSNDAYHKDECKNLLKVVDLFGDISDKEKHN